LRQAPFLMVPCSILRENRALLNPKCALENITGDSGRNVTTKLMQIVASMDSTGEATML